MVCTSFLQDVCLEDKSTSLITSLKLPHRVVRAIQMVNAEQHNADNVVVGQQDGCVCLCVHLSECVFV